MDFQAGKYGVAAVEQGQGKKRMFFNGDSLNGNIFAFQKTDSRSRPPLFEDIFFVTGFLLDALAEPVRMIEFPSLHMDHSAAGDSYITRPESINEIFIDVEGIVRCSRLNIGVIWEKSAVVRPVCRGVQNCTVFQMKPHIGFQFQRSGCKLSRRNDDRTASQRIECKINR